MKIWERPFDWGERGGRAGMPGDSRTLRAYTCESMTAVTHSFLLSALKPARNSLGRMDAGAPFSTGLTFVPNDAHNNKKNNVTIISGKGHLQMGRNEKLGIQRKRHKCLRVQIHIHTSHPRDRSGDININKHTHA